jgi:drug/metabolite transporter (DMT)-like permease
MTTSPRPAILAALASALLFGASTPLAKVLVAEVPPVALAGLLYLGAGVGLLVLRAVRGRFAGAAGRQEAPLERSDWTWLAGAILAGGVIAPVLLMLGLQHTQASTAALLLNLEGVFTALLAWFVFHENVDRRIAAGFFLIAAGGVLLSWQGGHAAGLPLGSLAVVAACLAWAVDNNLTQRVSGSDPLQVAGLKGLAAGAINLTIAVLAGWTPPAAAVLAAALGVGLLGYGVSLSLFVWALRHLGTARTGAYFSVAPFFGAAAAVAFLAERPGALFWAAAALMTIRRLAARHRAPRPPPPPRAPAPLATCTATTSTTMSTRIPRAGHGAEPHSHPHEHEPLLHAHPGTTRISITATGIAEAPGLGARDIACNIRCRTCSIRFP